MGGEWEWIREGGEGEEKIEVLKYTVPTYLPREKYEYTYSDLCL